MKKTPLYILLCLSTVSSLFKFFAVFLAERKEPPAMTTGDAQADKLLEETSRIVRMQFHFSQNMPNKLLVIVFFCLLGLSLFLVLRNRLTEASLSYLAYLLLSLGHTVYSYMGNRRIISLYSEKIIRDSSLWQLKLITGIQLGLFLILISTVLFLFLRKPKADSTDLGSI